MTVVPRHVVCVLGSWSSFDDVERVVREVGGEGFSLDDDYSMLGPDPRMQRAFDASRDRVTPSFTDLDWAAVKKHRAVAYVLSPPLEKPRAREISARTLALTAALLEAGGTAAKSDRHQEEHLVDEAQDRISPEGREPWFQSDRPGGSRIYRARRGRLRDAATA